MLTYNTQLKKLVLPEYGRNIQQMVDHCMTIADKEERTKCAYSIINTMGNLFPNLRDDEEFKHKLWDHLAIMSDFKLNIDYPCEVINAENLTTTPQRIEHLDSSIKLRHYGKYIELMVAKISTLEHSEEKNTLILLVANHMKKMQLAINCDGIDDAKIFKDLYELSNGLIKLDTENYHLHQFKEIHTHQASNKRKKKK